MGAYDDKVSDRFSPSSALANPAARVLTFSSTSARDHELRHPVRIPTIPITGSDKTITDSGGFRSPWRRAEVHRGAGVGLRV